MRYVTLSDTAYVLPLQRTRGNVGRMNTTELLSLTATELALSVDNVLIWALIMRRVGVPVRMHRRAIAAGVVIALVVRAIAIGAGAQAIERFSLLTPMLGAFLVYTAWKIVRGGDDDESVPGLVTLSRWIKSPVVLAIVALGVVDVVFAIDSIPASFGISSHPVTIVVANGIALAGLWVMYPIVSRLMDSLPYLSHGLAVILAWIGATMLFHDAVSVPEYVTLSVIAVSLVGSGLAGKTGISKEVAR